jgi:HEAT repeat protein
VIPFEPIMIRVLLLAFLVASFATVAKADDDPSFNGRKMSEWLVMLKDDSVPRKRRAAAVALGQIATDHKETRKFVLPALASALRTDPAAVVRGQAAVTLGQQPPEYGGAFVAELAECLRTEKDTAVKVDVSVTLGRIGKLAKAAVLPLTTILNDPDAKVRATAAEALGRIGSDAKPAAAALLKLMKDAEPAVRQQAIFALGRIEPDDLEPVVGALVSILQNETNRDLRLETVVALGLMVPKTAEVAAAIARTLTDQDAEIRKQACLTIAKLGFVARKVEPAVRAVMMRDADKEVRAVAVRALTAVYGSDISDLIPILTDRLKSDADFEVRMAIAEELGSFGAAGKKAIPDLRAAMKDPQIKVREAATMAIRQIEKPPAKPPANP